MYGTTHPYFASDMMVEAEAEMAFNAREVLPDIPVPVLLVCGDEDRYISKEMYEETARLIPDCTLRMYAGVGHVGAVRDERFPRDVLDFVRQRSAVQAERDAEQRPAAQPKRRAKRRTGTDQPAAIEEPTAIDQPAAATEPPATPAPSLAGSSGG
jgi:hypothetical protein